MDKHKGTFLRGESSNSQTSASASSSETVPVPSSTIQTSTPAPNSEVLSGEISKGQISAPVSSSKADIGQRSSVQINAAAPDHEVVPALNSIIRRFQTIATAPDSEIVPGQSSHSKTDAVDSNSEGVHGQNSNSIINVRTPISESAPGQSLNIKINAPASISDAAAEQLPNMQINAATTHSETALGQSSHNQTDAQPSNSEAILPIAGPTTLQPDEDTSEPTNTHLENDDSDFSSDDESTTSEPVEVQEWRRKLAYYKEIYDRNYGQQGEKSAEGTRNKKSDQPTSDMPSQAEGTRKQKAEDTISDMLTKTERMRKRKAGDPTSGMSPQEKLEYHHSVLKRYFEEAMKKANMQGYVYGIVLEDDTVLTGCSESLRKWWEETIKFEQAGPAAANQYILENQVKLANNNEPPQRTYNLLMKLGDGTLGSVLSALLWKCKPPQRKYPFKQKCPPPWWPTGNESWWVETGEKRPEPGQLQYKKPHDIKKKWKAIIVLSVIKHLAPKFDLIVKTVKASKNLQDRLNVREMEAWNFALKEEMKIYCQAHPDISLSDLLKAFQSHNVMVPVPQQRQVRPMENEAGDSRISPRPRKKMSLWSNQNRNFRFTCENQGCLHHEIEFGFQSAAVREKHHLTCKYQTKKNPFTAPGDLQPMFPPLNSTSNISEVVFGPFGSTTRDTVTPLCIISQVTVPQLGGTSQVNVQEFGSSYQESVPPFDSTSEGTVVPSVSTTEVTAPPMHLPEQMVQPSSQSMFTPVSVLPMHPPQNNLVLTDAGFSSYQSAPTSSLDMGQRHPGFGFGGFYSGPGSSSAGVCDDTGLDSSIGTYMQLLSDVQQNAMMMPPQQQLHSADPSIYQHLVENFNIGGGNVMQISNNIQPDDMPVPPQQQLYDAHPSMQQIILESFHGACEGSLSGVLSQTGFQPFQNTEMQLFLNDRAVETGTSEIQINVPLPEGIQFGQINPIGNSLALSQPYPAIPNISIQQASDIQQSEMQDVQTPVQHSAPQDAQTLTPSEELINSVLVTMNIGHTGHSSNKRGIRID